ncbi:MAG TPA: ATP-binding protein [Longimicrobium sp.]|nr:ATP-binding protein [Longimicrobium sp.]
MTNYTDAELEAMLSDLESDLAERKESFSGDAPNKVREAVCAFANDLPDHRRPGVVFIGARDRTGEPSGISITDELLLKLADIKTDGNIVPPPTMTVARRVLGGGPMAVLTVQPSDSPPVRYRGRVHIRIGPRRGIASAQDERILTEKRRARDTPFDVHSLAAASLADLDRVRFENEYLPAAFAPDVLEANERTLEQRLAVTKMVDAANTAVPTVLGVLVLGRAPRDFVPGAYLQFLRIAGRELGDPIVDELAVDGPVSELLRGIDHKLQAHNRTSVQITGGLREERRSDYPLSALQQLVRNAVMHRTYEATHAPVRVYWYDDRIEITSPGGPFGTVSAENFGEPGVADYRNPNLAEAMRVLGFVQRFGFGFPIARRALAENGNPPLELVAQPSHVTAVVRIGNGAREAGPGS